MFSLFLSQALGLEGSVHSTFSEVSCFSDADRRMETGFWESDGGGLALYPNPVLEISVFCDSYHIEG